MASPSSYATPSHHLSVISPTTLSTIDPLDDFLLFYNNTYMAASSSRALHSTFLNHAASIPRSSPLIPLTFPFSLRSNRVEKLIHTTSSGERFFDCRRTRASSMAEAAAAAAEKSKGKGEVQVFDSEEEIAVALAKYTADLSEKFCRERTAFTVVLSGGSLVKSLRKLVEPPYIDSVDWSKWHVFWVDERVVPKDHPDSNYLLAFDGFLSKIPIPPGNVYAINDALSAEGAAEDYETCLKHLVNNGTIAKSEASGFPKFDLMLLGMGPDGHVASLFPGHPLCEEDKKWVTFIKDSPKPPPERITFTFPVINSSEQIALVIAGAGKANAVQTALGNSRSPEVLPVSMVSPEGQLKWFLDKGAASNLKLVEPPYVGSVNWSKWLIFWADERVVPLDDPDSNYKLAYDGFLSKVPIPAGNIYAINYKKSPKYSADDYEARLKQLVKRKIIPLSKSSGFPKFDLMLLGIGPDGHVASLFPSRPQRYEKKRWVTFIKDAPFPPRARITFTFPVINSASEIAMVITGASKADAVKQVLGKYSHPPGVKLLPAAQVSAEGELIWFLDKDAASKL